MVEFLAAITNAVNILLCIGMLGYSMRWFLLLRGGRMQKALRGLVGSVVFFLLAALFRGALLWSIISPELDYLPSALRTIAFVLLFYALIVSVRIWSNFGSKP